MLCKFGCPEVNCQQFCFQRGRHIDVVQRFQSCSLSSFQLGCGTVCCSSVQVLVKEMSLHDLYIGRRSPLQQHLFLLDVHVEGVNDSPRVFLVEDESQVTIDDSNPFALSELVAVDDVDGLEERVTLTISIDHGMDGGNLKICEMGETAVELLEPAEGDRGGNEDCMVPSSTKLVLRGTVAALNVLLESSTSQLSS